MIQFPTSSLVLPGGLKSYNWLLFHLYMTMLKFDGLALKVDKDGEVYTIYVEYKTPYNAERIYATDPIILKPREK